ncbi:growth differentiation factor 7 [Pelobates cultripes]|uniref:Growth differentiation factor 7 n=1 Tax=Pelobates cultripes TaxID=61616 RepID=A0AAD1VQE2_PELCU|nr:growth differentiation factor 7 [Pelobates cultripes]
MDLRKAAALCLGLWSAWLWAGQNSQAASVLPPSHKLPGATKRDLLSGHTFATLHKDPKNHILSRKEPVGKGTVIPHDYMLSLYKSLSRREPRGLKSNLTRDKAVANTITSFVDQGEDDWGHRTTNCKLFELELSGLDGFSRLMGRRHSGHACRAFRACRACRACRTFSVDDTVLPSPEQMYLFDTSSLPEMDDIVNAELRVLRRFPTNTSSVISETGNLVHFHVYTCPTTWEEPKVLDSRSSDLLDSTRSKWEVFQVLKAMDNRKHPLCLMLKMTSDLTEKSLPPLQLGFNRHGEEANEKPLLVVYSHSKRKENLFKEIRDKIKSMGNPKVLEPPDSGQRSITRRRSKRSTLPTRTHNGKGNGKRSKTRCSKKPLHVNFKELGWDDWIIAPLDYEAYHCEGVCDFPLRSHLEPTNHAIIQTLMNSMDPESTPPSCCVPSKLSPISILYIDSGNNVVYKQYEDMVVESCGCR